MKGCKADADTAWVAAGVVAAPVGAWVAYRLYQRYKALNAVSATAVGVLGGRALDTLQPEALLHDELAVGILGPFGVAAADRRVKAFAAAAAVKNPDALKEAEKDAANDAAKGGKDQGPVQRRGGSLSWRCLWLEEQLLAALDATTRQQPPSKKQQAVAEPKENSSNGQGSGLAPQVVLLGAGMDTRPWRLTLPPGVSWWELDQADLLAAKTAALDSLAVQQNVAGQPSRTGLGPQLLGLVRQAGWLLQLRWAGLVARVRRDVVLQQVVDYLNKQIVPKLTLLGGGGIQLLPATRTTLVVNFNHSGWLDKLLAAGFDPARPTVWVAEGLFYYLDPPAALTLLEGVGSVSAPGSTLIATMMNEAMGTWVNLQLNSGAWPRSVMATLWKFYCPQDLKPFLAATGGWQLVKAPDAREAMAEKGWAVDNVFMNPRDWVDEHGHKPKYHWVVATK